MMIYLFKAHINTLFPSPDKTGALISALLGCEGMQGASDFSREPSGFFFLFIILKKTPTLSFSEVVNALMSLIFAQMFLGVCRFSVYFDITKEPAPAIAHSLTSK